MVFGTKIPLTIILKQNKTENWQSLLSEQYFDNVKDLDGHGRMSLVKFKRAIPCQTTTCKGKKDAG